MKLFIQRIALMLSVVALATAATATVQAAGVEEVQQFGSNPGGLKMYKYVPKNMKNPKAMVLVLHGCLQNVSESDDEPGWISLADRGGFALLFPEQQKANNGAQCFNWFTPADARRGQGELESISQMIQKMIKDEGVSPQHFYLSGFSSGGAVAAAMLANYPEVFQGAAIFSGVPYGCANAVNDGFLCMNGMYKKTAKEWGDLVRAAAKYNGPRAKVSIWHGTSDQIIRPLVGDELVKQWTDVMGTPATPAQEKKTPGLTYQAFASSNGSIAVEYYQVLGMKHGQPIKTGSGKDACGKTGRYVLDAKVCGSYVMTRTWGLLTEAE